jgi:stage II sporulation protein AA (anti-sigma F factor antagonist)
MANNFRISAKERSDRSLALQLYGDFDASSACELINLLVESIKTTSKVAIDTDGLRTINSFGLDVFLPRVGRLNNSRADIEVTGRFSSVFDDG